MARTTYGPTIPSDFALSLGCPICADGKAADPDKSGVVAIDCRVVAAGQRWQDNVGQVRVLAVAEGYAMLRRRRSNPFIASTDQMLRGDYGWTLLADANDSAGGQRRG